MIVEQGWSSKRGASDAVDEATRPFPTVEFEIVFAFCSTSQDPIGVAAALQARFPTALVAGCTTSGEHLNGMPLQNALVVTGLRDTGIRWAVAPVRDLQGFDRAAATRLVTALFARLDTTIDDADPEECFCIAFVDGLRGAEERFSARLADALGGVALVGGSAGDDQAFVETRVFSGGQSHTGAAVVIVGRGRRAFRVLKHQHFVPTGKHLIVTRVDPTGRRVLELDGRPAFRAYASALGLTREGVSPDVSFLHPVMFSCEGQSYVRAIRSINPDDSMTFFCGVDEGMVLELGRHQDMVEALDKDFARMTAGLGKFHFLLGFNCILRALESRKRHQADELGTLWRKIAVHSIGFDTYGEQLDGLHINQTLVAIGFGLTREGVDDV